MFNVTGQRDYSSIVKSLYECFNNRDFDRAMSYMASDLEWTNVPFGKSFKGSAGFKEFWNNWLTAFPDGKCDVTNLYPSGDYVIAEFTGRGTNSGTLVGPSGQIPATGRKVEIPFIEVFQFKDGKLYRGRTYFDAATMFRSLGLTQ